MSAKLMGQSTSHEKRRQYLFAYGTLLPGLAPSGMQPVVKKLKPVGRGFVRGKLFDLGAYPGAVLSRTESQIHGQIYEIPDDGEALARLDGYEEFDPKSPQGSPFIRERCLAKLEDGTKQVCWIYTYKGPVEGAKIIEGGDYRTCDIVRRGS